MLWRGVPGLGLSCSGHQIVRKMGAGERQPANRVGGWTAPNNKVSGSCSGVLVPNDRVACAGGRGGFVPRGASSWLRYWGLGGQRTAVLR